MSAINMCSSLYVIICPFLFKPLIKVINQPNTKMSRRIS